MNKPLDTRSLENPSEAFKQIGVKLFGSVSEKLTELPKKVGLLQDLVILGFMFLLIMVATIVVMVALVLIDSFSNREKPQIMYSIDITSDTMEDIGLGNKKTELLLEKIEKNIESLQRSVEEKK